MKTSASLRKFLHCIYGYAFFNKLLLISPVYAVFMQDHGMSDMQLSVLFIKNRCAVETKVRKNAIKAPRQIGSDIV